MTPSPSPRLSTLALALVTGLASVAVPPAFGVASVPGPLPAGSPAPGPTSAGPLLPGATSAGSPVPGATSARSPFPGAISAVPRAGPAAPGVGSVAPRAPDASAAVPRAGPPIRQPNTSAERFGWPLAPPHPVLRPFEAPDSPYGPGHRGVDLGGSPGEAVLAAGAGVVVFAGQLAGRGVVSVDHANGLRTTYEPLAPTVTTGQRVGAGAVLGRLRPGHARCPVAACLHWGARRGDEYLDPLALVSSGRVRLLPWKEVS